MRALAFVVTVCTGLAVLVLACDARETNRQATGLTAPAQRRPAGQMSAGGVEIAEGPFTGTVRRLAGAAARFVPDYNATLRLRLTTIPMQAALLPEDNEIDLGRWENRTITFAGQRADGEWVWGVEEGSIQVVP